MIKLENTEVFGWDAAVRGMRNPMNSWDKSDSEYKTRCSDPGSNGQIWCTNCGYDACNPDWADAEYVIGDNDLNLMKKLVKAGSDHSKFMRMINVTVDITAPLYWWKEFDTYKVGTVRNSCSTMHKITAKEFELDDFSHEHLTCIGKGVLHSVIEHLNKNRQYYLEEPNGTQNKKDYWWEIIQLLPSSYNQKATVQVSYAMLRNAYHSRKNHKLDEWSNGFCKWVESLPYSELITMRGD